MASRFPRRGRALCAGVLSLCTGLAGCSLDAAGTRVAAGALAGQGDVFASDDDPDLIAAAAPFGLKVTDALIAKRPDDRTLRLSAARGYAQYAYAFVQLPADPLEARDVGAAYEQRARARRLYLRARDHGLAALGLAPDFQEQGASSLTRMRRENAEALYWTAAAWFGAITLAKDDPVMLASLPRAQALLDRAEALDADAAGGAIHVLQLAVEAGRPDAGADALERARRRYERALSVTGGRDAGVHVAMAEAIAQRRGTKAEFEALLQRALSVNADADPARRLANHVAQRRARWLVTQTEDLYPE